MSPAKPGESTEVPVGRDPLTAALDRERGKVRVGDEVAAGAGGAAETLEDRPVAFAGRDEDRVRLGTKAIGELERGGDRDRWIEHPGMGHDAYESAQHQL